ncbi:hypothetical protein JDW21_21440 [Bacillus subtilis]|uniref:hypothetical protein n=1 Tax=Bacillus TaxID=1386 RepID=UPI0011A5F416|nr:hypothetical protein [Bacillus subtilis]WIT27252.1 hypothetical protein [Bacillus phage SPbetaL3]MBT2165622.1 hypothetical protein [Bacillus subtilis]MDD9765733.1 hypothetical protein [Bacillus subtilis]MDD9768689.1 hypothetical protein [Bacillus subtilis]MDD9772630.1 hypothetical protein [Bacillus subtilis]
MWFIKKKIKKEPNKLKEVLENWNDEELIEYITDSFSYFHNNNPRIELNRLRGLDKDTITLAIARMIQIEEAYDNSKIASGIVVGTFFIKAVVDFLKYNIDEKSFNYLLSLFYAVVMAAVFFLLVTFGVNKGKKHRSNASRYRSLLEQVKSEKEK